MYDDTPVPPIVSFPTVPLALRIDDATIDKVANITGLKLPQWIDAALLNRTLQTLSEVAVLPLPTAAMPLEKKLAWVLRIITVVTASLTMILASYNASKPSPATPADVAPEKIADAVWGP